MEANWLWIIAGISLTVTFGGFALYAILVMSDKIG